MIAVQPRDRRVVKRAQAGRLRRAITLERELGDRQVQIMLSGSGERIEALAASERDGLGEHRHVGSGQQIVGQLHRLAGAGRSHVRNNLAELVEHRQHAGKGIGVPSHHDRQRPRRRTPRSTADWRVEDLHSARRARRSHPPRELRRARAHVHHHCSRMGRREDALGAEDHLLDYG